MKLNGDYLKVLSDRGKESRVYRKYQLIGLEIAQMLHDQEHKALYIKLAKEYPADELLGLAKGIAERSDIKNHGAYFMRVVTARRKR